MIHRLLHRHWPVWFRADYDGLTWRYRCAVCEPNHRDAPTRVERKEKSIKVTTNFGRKKNKNF
jgi:hypothetical protein